MSEIRQDVTTKEWVIIATERLQRPTDFQNKTPKAEKPLYLNTCPFCPGNESMTKPAVLSYTDSKTGAWQVRVVTNIYPAVTPDGGTTRKVDRGFFLGTEATGHHEVIIENPAHNKTLALMTDTELTNVLRAYRQRYTDMAADPKIRSIIIFKNHGPGAGTSLEHPHSQIVATTIIPRHMRTQYEIAISYYDDNGRSLYAALTTHELDAGNRIITNTKKYVVFHPFASHRPFETWIMPTDCQASFGKSCEEDLPDLANVLKNTLLKLYHGLDDPDFNLVIDSAPVGEEHTEIYQWHIRIIPRITTQAGFEIGTGIYINTALPEETAKFIRNLKVKS